MTQRCDAGGDASFGGRWNVPCLREATNALAFGAHEGPRAPGTPIFWFCAEHMAELIEAGMIEEVAVDPVEWKRRADGGRTPR